jgi:hypothetical protein
MTRWPNQLGSEARVAQEPTIKIAQEPPLNILGQPSVWIDKAALGAKNLLAFASAAKGQHVWPCIDGLHSGKRFKN